jgi:HlyD family secretion protein
MKRLAVCLVLCFVVFCWAPGRFMVCAAEAEKSPAAKKEVKKEEPKKETKVDKAKEEKEKAEKAKKDAKPAADEGPKKTEAKKEEAKKDAAKKEEPKKEEPKKPAPPVHEVKAEPFQVTVELKGVFEAKRMTDVSIWPEEWSGYTVLKAVEHGKQVKQGDLLIACDPEQIDRTIDDLRRQLKLTDIEMVRLQEQVRSLEKLTPMDLEAIDRGQRIAKEDYEQFLKVDMPMSKELAEFSLKSSKEQLDYAKEELAQLEKMYKADDLTEETEEIVLRRARFEVAMSEMYYKMSQQRYDEMKKFGFPRREESEKDSIDRTTFGLKQAKIVLPLALKKARLDIAKAKIEYERMEKRLNDLLADRVFMTVKAPATGTLYYGECVDGRWTGMTSASSFDRGSMVPTKKTFMTIVDTRPLVIRSTVGEKDVRNMREGVKGKATPTAYPEARLETVLAEIAAVPDAQNNFNTKLMVTEQGSLGVMPGMSCSVKLVVYKKDKAITIPPTALGTDSVDDSKHFVHVVGKDGKSAKRDVTIGERNAKAIEILKGLAAGDKVLKTCPPDDEKPQK